MAIITDFVAGDNAGHIIEPAQSGATVLHSGVCNNDTVHAIDYSPTSDSLVYTGNSPASGFWGRLSSLGFWEHPKTGTGVMYDVSATETTDEMISVGNWGTGNQGIFASSIQYNSMLWSRVDIAGAIAVIPQENHGRVFVGSNANEIIYSLDLTTGNTLNTYRTETDWGWTGATDTESILPDPNNPGYFFVNDDGNGKIKYTDLTGVTQWSTPTVGATNIDKFSIDKTHLAIQYSDKEVLYTYSPTSVAEIYSVAETPPQNKKPILTGDGRWAYIDGSNNIVVRDTSGSLLWSDSTYNYTALSHINGDYARVGSAKPVGPTGLTATM